MNPVSIVRITEKYFRRPLILIKLFLSILPHFRDVIIAKSQVLAYSPPREEGWPRHKKKGPVPKRRGRGGRSYIIFQNAFRKWDL